MEEGGRPGRAVDWQETDLNGRMTEADRSACLEASGYAGLLRTTNSQQASCRGTSDAHLSTRTRPGIESAGRPQRGFAGRCVPGRLGN